MIYGYVRVSSVYQNIDRQIEGLHKYGLLISRFTLISSWEKTLIELYIKNLLGSLNPMIYY